MIGGAAAMGASSSDIYWQFITDHFVILGDLITSLNSANSNQGVSL